MKRLISLFRSRKSGNNTPTAPDSQIPQESFPASSPITREPILLYPQIHLPQLPPTTPPPPGPHLDPETAQSILASFSCPFRLESACRHESTPSSCPFGHPPTSSSHLLPLPDYLCIYHLLGKCPHPPKPTLTRSQGLTGCTSAIHLSVSCLLDLDAFETENAHAIVQYFNDHLTSSEATPGGTVRRRQRAARRNLEGDEECGICFERIRAKYLRETRRFALLEACDHVFCGPCMVEYRGQRPEGQRHVVCPLCRVPSKRFYLSQRFITSDSLEKRRIFEAYRCSCCE